MLLSTLVVVMALAAACNDKKSDTADAGVKPVATPATPPPSTTPATTAADVKPENADATAAALAKEIDSDKE